MKEPETLNLLNINLLKDFKKGKIIIKTTKSRKGSSITIGVITKELFDLFNFKGPVKWQADTYKGKLFTYDNSGAVFGHSHNPLTTTFSEGSTVELTLEDKLMKIKVKKNVCEYKLPEENLYFFFNLVGNSEIEINYSR